MKTTLAKINISDVKLEAKVSSVLRNTGVPMHVRGYEYLKLGILKAVRNREYLSELTTKLYPDVAAETHTKGTRVERNMRHAIDIAWTRVTEPSVLDKQVELFPSLGKYKPTNGHFIACIAEHIRMQVLEEAESEEPTAV